MFSSCQGTLHGSALPPVSGRRFLAVWLAGIFLASSVPGIAGSEGSSSGRPPERPAAVTSYAARTDRKMEAYPDTLPRLGPAGSVFTDPSFGSRMARITDDKADRPGQSFHTPGSA